LLQFDNAMLSLQTHEMDSRGGVWEFFVATPWQLQSDLGVSTWAWAC
jgi:hypothetical protein